MEERKRLIFIVDDDETVRMIMERYLQAEGFRVQTFALAEDALEAWEREAPDMFIIDIMMPGVDGYELCRRIRARSMVPIIMVSAKDDEVDKIVGLELGSDDYLSKPFSPRELVVRVKTMFRRIDAMLSGKVETEKQPVLQIGDLKLYLDERRITKEDTEISLTTKEYDLFSYLATNRNKAFTREQLLNQVWGYDYIGDERAIDDLVKRLRKKLRAADSSVEIKTVWGYGYKLEG
ncbi:DNA-binding response regulator [Collibacillus ludicampi]|uniref:DNA-binding response regulator n=1 Tax=Collibacillus ludicampi TaxID=2771369 RepID=A0AAV4LGD7_9BACL|nr:response regulator transcription factor [Collibacillus ludicampi]GIM46811.1 DNA-binding response regulator [Collibacillus ludicampi]